MKAIQKLKPGLGNISVVDIPEPAPEDDEVKIKVAYAGICGTDMAIYNGTKPTNPPLVMGHEFSGIITEVGKNVTGWKIGDRVISETTKLCCNDCDFCRTGQHSLCKKREALGQQLDGVFADYCTQKASFLHHLPSTISFRDAALSEPAACAYHAVYELNDIKPIDHCLVIGPGTIGLLVVQLLKALGAYVVVMGRKGTDSKLELARSLKADYAFDASKAEISKVLDEHTNGKGFDFVFECSGSEAAIQSSFDLAKTSGTIVQVGIPPLTGVSIPSYSKVMLKELKVQGAISQRYLNWDRVVELMERGLLNPEPLISHTFTLNQAQDAFDAKGKIKVLFEIHPELDV